MDVADYESTVESDIDLYDTERVRLNQALNVIRASVGTRRNLESFRQEILDSMWQCGFRVDVRVFEGTMEDDPSQETIFFFKLVIVGRSESEEEFDHDRMKHEVLNDVIGQGDVEKKSTPISMHSDGKNKRTSSGLYLP